MEENKNSQQKHSLQQKADECNKVKYLEFHGKHTDSTDFH